MILSIPEKFKIFKYSYINQTVTFSDPPGSILVFLCPHTSLEPMPESIYYDCNSTLESFAANEHPGSVETAGTLRSAREKLLLELPRYMPPSLDTLILFNLVQVSNNLKVQLKEPPVPRVRTSTSLATYAHKLFVYNFRLANAYTTIGRPRDPMTYSFLKHSYDECLSQQVAVNMVRRNTLLHVPKT